jgi:hypothetical protein
VLYSSLNVLGLRHLSRRRVARSGTMIWMKESMAKKSSVATEIEIFGAV